MLSAMIKKLLNCGTKRRLAGLIAFFFAITTIGVYVLPGAGIHDFALNDGEVAGSAQSLQGAVSETIQYRFTEIEENEVPLSTIPPEIRMSASYSFMAWSLLDLILIIVTCIIMLGTLAIFFRGRNEGIDRGSIYGERKKRRIFLGIITVIITAVSITVFIMTQDMTLPMVVMDEWLVLHAVIAVAAILAVDYDRMLSEEEDGFYLGRA